MRSPLSSPLATSVVRLLAVSLLFLSAPALAEEEHAEADGMVLFQGGTEVVVQWDGAISGEIEVEEGVASAPIDVYFLDPDSTLFQPDPLEHELRFVNADSTALTVTKTGDWQFTVTGNEHGHVDLQVVIWHEGHADFTSLEFEVHVEEEHAEAEGLYLVQDLESIVTQWEGLVTGEIEAHEDEASSPIDIFFLDADSLAFQPDDPEFALLLSVDDTTVATVTQTGDWQFTVTGHEHGHTDLLISIFHDGHSDFTSLPIEIHVEEEHGHAEPDGLFLVQGETEHVRQWEGVLTGAIVLPEASTTPSFDLWFLDHDGDAFVPEDEDFEMQWSIADETVATIEATGDWSFRVNGLLGGSTTVNLVIWHDGHADFTSMAIPIDVETATAAPGPAITQLSMRPATPNPFSSTTSIAYALPTRTNVKVQVFDVRGRLVETVFDGVQDPGEYRTVFDGRERANGVYFVRLTTPEQSVTQKMISVR